jgi:hypothetical protein
MISGGTASFNSGTFDNQFLWSRIPQERAAMPME